MAEQSTTSSATGVKTTGHVWDGDLQEFNNPLPVWWTYTFYVTIVFALVYWVVYPSWPIGKGFLPGVNTITYKNAEGEEETWHWNTRSKLLLETQEAAAAQKPYYDKLAALPYERITKGRRGYMPPFAEALSAAQIDELANYVASLSGLKADTAKVAKGDALFHSHTAACFYCHNDDAKGRKDIGSANLTDKVWLWADVPGAADDAGKVAAIGKVISAGLDKGVMPAWQGRLSAQQIKLLTVYVHELGGGK